MRRDELIKQIDTFTDRTETMVTGSSTPPRVATALSLLAECRRELAREEPFAVQAPTFVRASPASVIDLMGQATKTLQDKVDAGERAISARRVEQEWLDEARDEALARLDVEERSTSAQEAANAFSDIDATLSPAFKGLSQMLNEALYGDDGHDPVNHPSHYTSHPSGVECIDVTQHMNFCLGNATKYIWRCDEKGDPIRDIRKAIWYLNCEIERREQQGEN